ITIEIEQPVVRGGLLADALLEAVPDATVEICTDLGARVIHQPWLGNGFQKRVGEEASANDWLLDLDGDEIVTGELKDEIRALFAGVEPSGSVYALKLSTVDPTGREWIGYGESYRNKLYDRRRHRMPEHRMWDQLELPSDVKPVQLNGRIRHHAFSDFAHVSNKLNRGSSRRAEYGKQRSKSALRFRVLFLFPFYFFKHFLQRRFVKGGTYGFAHAMVAAHGRWLRDAKQYEALLIEEARARGDIPPAATSGDD
ncbi:MAG: hypothetical protein AAFZ05_04765, partial [Pseudomonadota bacterium]